MHKPPPSRYFLKISAALAVLSCPVYADSFTWNGGGANDDWSTGTNWDGGTAPASATDTALEFAGGTRLTPNADAPWSLGAITFNTGAGAFTITGSGLELAAGGSVGNRSANTQTIANSSINLPGVSTWDTSGGDLIVNGAITGNQVFFDVSGSVVKTGAGTLTLAGSNTYGQGTTVKSGTLAIVAGGVVDNGQAYANVYVGEASGDVGSFVVDGGELHTGGLRIGDGGSTGSVVMNEGILSSSNQILIGGAFGGGGVGNFEVHGGSISTFGTTFVGYVGTGTMTMTGGTWVSQNGVSVGASGGMGTFVVSGGTVAFDGGTSIDAGSSLTISGSANYTHEGMSIDGSFLLEGGVVTGTSSVSIGGVATVNSGTWTQSGGGSVGVFGSGTLNVNGGYVSTISTGLADSLVGVEGDGIVNITGGTWAHAGTLDVGGFYFEGFGAFGGNGVVTVSGGLMDVSGTLSVGAGTGSALFNISGSTGNRGVVAANRIVKGTGTATLNINGGVLRAKANESDFLAGFAAGDVTIDTGGATIDTQAFTIGIATALSGTGGLTKVGSGTLTLSGSNIQAGETVVSAGTLIVNGDNSDAGGVTVEDEAAFGGTGIVSNLTVQNGGTVLPGNSPGLLTVEGDLTMQAGSTIVMEFTGTGAGAFDQLAIGGGFTAGGPLFLDVSYGAVGGDTFTIFTEDGITGRGWDAGSFTIATNLGGGLSWDTSSLASAGIVTVVPEPTSMALLALGGALLIGARRRP